MARPTTGDLYWSEQGEICCAEHAPYPESDTWLAGRWKRITPTERLEAAAAGLEVVCEGCRARARRA